MIHGSESGCTGCHACYSKCPVDAIRMVPDAEGFLRPVVNLDACIRCGLCKSVCPILQPRRLAGVREPQVFAAWSRDEEQRRLSTSGGVFSELAKIVLAKGGCVAGARYKTDHTVEHACIRDERDLPLLRQSKYTQSDIGHSFRQIQVSLADGLPLLFCGTPCQAAGLLGFLGKAPENLILCDFVCRGITSPMVYKMYLADLERECGAPVDIIQFKNKNVGWNQFCTFVRFKNGRTYQQDRYRDPFMYGYLMTNLYLRPCCYCCRYKDIPRVADISLGDFWGIADTRPHMDDNNGTSLVLVNTEKGRNLLDAARGALTIEECRLEEALQGNQHILRAAWRPHGRKRFFRKLREAGSLTSVIDEYRTNRGGAGFLSRLWRMLGRGRRNMTGKTQPRRTAQLDAGP